MASRQSPDRTAASSGFTIVELLVVIALIAVLMALLLPALSAIRTQSQMAKSMSNMRQIGTYVQNYVGEHRDIILPSQFDYNNNSYPGHVAAPINHAGQAVELEDRDPPRHRGTWADIIWTKYELGRFPNLHNAGIGDAIVSHDYGRAAPDWRIYDELGETWDGNILRSAARNTRNANPGVSNSVRKPYGEGANEMDLPGFFAANDFFDARPDAPALELPDGTILETPPNGRWYTMGQIRSPSRSLYLVDSFYGETIAPQPPPWDNAAGIPTIEVDYRYAGACLILRLDGSVVPETRWMDLDNLQQDRQVRVQHLDRRSAY